MLSMDCSKMVHFQYDFYKESSKINTSHMVPIHQILSGKKSIFTWNSIQSVHFYCFYYFILTNFFIYITVF